VHVVLFDENGKNQEVRYISYTIASDYIEINDEFGFNVKNDKGIVQIFYKNDMYN
jgi:hypothetical protein